MSPELKRLIAQLRRSEMRKDEARLMDNTKGLEFLGSEDLGKVAAYAFPNSAQAIANGTYEPYHGFEDGASLLQRMLYSIFDGDKGAMVNRGQFKNERDFKDPYFALDYLTSKVKR
jgi:hypothetical protein